MNLSFKLLVAVAVFVASFAVGAQTIFSSSGYSTGEAKSTAGTTQSAAVH